MSANLRHLSRVAAYSGKSGKMDKLGNLKQLGRKHGKTPWA